MELYFVKDEVKIIPLSEAFSKSREYNGYIKQPNDYHGEDGCLTAADFDGVGASSESQDEDDRTLLKVSDLPVVLKSICCEADTSEHSEQFAERVGWRLQNRGEIDSLGNMKVELVISNSMDGYFLLSTQSPEDGSKINVLKRLYEDLHHAEFKFMIEVSLCHLSTVKDALSPPKSLVCLKSGEIGCCSLEYRMGSSIPVRISPKVIKWLEQGTGFIYSKVSIRVTLIEDAVNWAYGYSPVNEGLLGCNPFTDLEIECKSGEIIDCHRALLAEKSGVLWRKLEEMAERKKVGPCKLKMTEMSEVAVKEFLEYIYCDKVSGGVWGCDVALELFKAGRHYEVAGLPMAMEEIIMAKESSDLEYFSRQSAEDLFVYARKNGKDMKHLMDKATRVLHNFPETATDEKVGSKEYQDLFEDEPLVNSFPWKEVLQEMLPILMVVLYAVAVAKKRGGGASGN